MSLASRALERITRFLLMVSLASAGCADGGGERGASRGQQVESVDDSVRHVSAAFMQAAVNGEGARMNELAVNKTVLRWRLIPGHVISRALDEAAKDGFHIAGEPAWRGDSALVTYMVGGGEEGTPLQLAVVRTAVGWRVSEVYLGPK